MPTHTHTTFFWPSTSNNESAPRASSMIHPSHEITPTTQSHAVLCRQHWQLLDVCLERTAGARHDALRRPARATAAVVVLVRPRLAVGISSGELSRSCSHEVKPVRRLVPGLSWPLRLRVRLGHEAFATEKGLCGSTRGRGHRIVAHVQHSPSDQRVEHTRQRMKEIVRGLDRRQVRHVGE